MKFSFAVAALANSLTTDHGTGGLVEAREERNDLLRSFLQAPDFDRRSLLARKAVASRRRSAEKRGVLRNLFSQDSFLKGECDPDVGLLACGFGQFCQSSSESTRGGLCVPLPGTAITRDLQIANPITLTENCTDCLRGPAAYCDPISPLYGKFTCDCENWNVSSKIGKIACELSPYECNANCTESSSCYSVDFDFVTDGSNFAYQYCYQFRSPVNQSFCFGYKNDKTCHIAVDGTLCTSCNTTYQLQCVGGSCTSEPCALFDCENIGLGTGNACQEVVIPPASYQCWLEMNDVYPKCSVCPNAGGVSNADASIDLPGYGTFNCTYMEAAANKGLFSPQLCSYAAIVANNTCCGSNPGPYFCNICGEEDYVVSKGKPNINNSKNGE